MSFRRLLVAAHPPSTHTYRLLLVKEPVCLASFHQQRRESLCSSAAEKRDYAAFSSPRQLLVRKFLYHDCFLLPHHTTSSGSANNLAVRRDANYIKGCENLASAITPLILRGIASSLLLPQGRYSSLPAPVAGISSRLDTTAWRFRRHPSASPASASPVPRSVRRASR